ncbi:right-handed parallel beta-helix repeat-containing protein [Candidatus Bathyarchaeota archaeon]|nr:right-handed parallel beta-helix repeat-containing protein [Candidatus Bathyarchaeota archaeon]
MPQIIKTELARLGAMLMRKIAVIAISALFILLTLNGHSASGSPGEIHVPYDQATIQEAVDAADPGDTIIVHSGIYNESIVIDKELVLDGVDQTAVIDGEGTGTVINVNSSNVVVKNFTIQNAGGDWSQRDSGIYARDMEFCYFESNHIENCRLGIYLWMSSHIEVASNTLIGNVEGLRLDGSSNNSISYNTIAENDWNLVLSSDSRQNDVKGNHVANGTYSGIHIQMWSNNNTIYGNKIENCGTGVLLSQSNNNTLYHNSFIDNTDQAWIGSSLNNSWDMGWPIGGNFWNTHSNIDVKSGEYQMGTGSDGICDSTYGVDASNMDMYPCAGPINYFEVDFAGPEDIVVISNSTISDFEMNATEKTIIFLATGEASVGFSRVDISNTVVDGIWQNNYQVLVNGVPTDFGNWTEGSLTYIYFRYEHSTEEITIIPEFSTAALLAFAMVSVLLVAVCRKKGILST